MKLSHLWRALGGEGKEKTNGLELMRGEDRDVSLDTDEYSMSA